MEARTKIIAAVAVITMCAAGLVGAGYAYTATTTNSSNTVVSEYVVLQQDGTGAYNFVNNQHVYYDVANPSSGTFNYSLDGHQPITVASANDYEGIKIGATFEVQASKNPSTGLENLTCSLAIDDIAKVGLTSSYVFIFKFTTEKPDTDPQIFVYNGAAASVADFTIYANAAGTSYYDTAVEVYYGYPANNVPTAAPGATPLNGAVFTFTVENDLHNSLALDSYANLSAGHTLGDVTCVVKCGADTLTLTTDYTISFKNAEGTGDVLPGTTNIAAGTTYTLIITGAGDYTGHYAEYKVTAPAAP